MKGTVSKYQMLYISHLSVSLQWPECVNDVHIIKTLSLSGCPIRKEHLDYLCRNEISQTVLKRFAFLKGDLLFGL